MKTVINVGIGGRSFIINEDAYQKLDIYLERFKQKTKMGEEANEVIEELEIRIAELFEEGLCSNQHVVTIEMVNSVISQLGLPDGSDANTEFSTNYTNKEMRTEKKFFRDPDNKVIGGICGGLAAYLDVDITLVRIIFLVLLICGSFGFWMYVIFWIVAPMAKSASDKCQMRGLPITAENLRRFSYSK